MGTALPRAPAPLSRSDTAERLASWPSRSPLASRVHRPGSLDTIGYIAATVRLVALRLVAAIVQTESATPNGRE